MNGFLLLLKRNVTSFFRQITDGKRQVVIAVVAFLLLAGVVATPVFLIPAAKEYAAAQKVKSDAEALQAHLQKASEKLQKLTALRETSPFTAIPQSYQNEERQTAFRIIPIASAQSSYKSSQLSQYLQHANATAVLSNDLLVEIQAIKDATVSLQEQVGTPNRYVDENFYIEIASSIKESENAISATSDIATFYAEYSEAAALFATGIARVEITLQEKQDVQDAITVAQTQLTDANEILAAINKNEGFPQEFQAISNETQKAYTELSKALTKLTTLSKNDPATQVAYLQTEIVEQLVLDYEEWRQIEAKVLSEQTTIDQFQAKAQELSQKIDKANQAQPSGLQVVIKVFTKEEDVVVLPKDQPTPTPTGFLTFRGMHIDSTNNPIVLPGQKVTVTNLKTGEATLTLSVPKFFFANLTPGAMYRVVADQISGYQISNMVCYNCTSPTSYAYNNGNTFDILIPENTFYGVYFKYAKTDASSTPTPLVIDDLGITVVNLKTKFTITAGQSQPAFTIRSTGATGISMYGYPTSYGPGINWSVSSAGLMVGGSVPISMQVTGNVPAGTYKGSAIIISLPSNKRYTIPNIEVTVEKATSVSTPVPTSGSGSGTNPTPTVTTAPTQASLGLQVSASSVDLTIEDGKSAKAFDITSTGATGFSLYGYPTEYGAGINWSVSSGGITPGSSVPVSVQVNSGINPGTYSGTAIIKNQSGVQISIPVKITVVRTQASRYVKILAPNGGETLKAGDTFTVQWEGNDIDKCNIGYTFGPGSRNDINSNVPTTGNGSYAWTVNIGNTTNTQVKIDLLCYKTGIGQVSDQSDTFFTVNP